MAVKQNLPVLFALLIAGAIAGGVFLIQPPDEDQLRQAAQAHAQTLGQVQEVTLTGSVAEVLLKDQRIFWIQFEKRDGHWVFARDAGHEFERAMKDAHVQGELVQRLGQRLSQRLRKDIKFKDGLEYQYGIIKDEHGMAGLCRTGFQYPPGQDGKARRGQYLEVFRWNGSCWKSEGVGSLFDSTAKP